MAAVVSEAAAGQTADCPLLTSTHQFVERLRPGPHQPRCGGLRGHCQRCKAQPDCELRLRTNKNPPAKDTRTRGAMLSVQRKRGGVAGGRCLHAVGNTLAQAEKV